MTTSESPREKVVRLIREMRNRTVDRGATPAEAAAFVAAYPNTKTHRSHTDYDLTAQARGREAGRQVSLNLQIGG